MFIGIIAVTPVKFRLIPGRFLSKNLINMFIISNTKQKRFWPNVLSKFREISVNVRGWSDET